jgi:hypothetical protein
MTDRLPAPGPSFVEERPLRADRPDRRAGLTRPTRTDDAWWLTVLWVTDDAGILDFTDLAPSVGPPPDPPLARLGPAMAGALSGLIAEEDGRLAIRLAPVVPPADPTRPWRSPAAVRAAMRFEAARALTLGDAGLAEAVLDAFRRAAAGLAHG